MIRPSPRLPLAQRLARHRDEVRELVRTAVDEAHPAVARLPAAAQDLREDITVLALDRAHDLWPDDLPAPEADLARYAEQAADAAVRGLGLRDLLGAYELAGAVMMRHHWSVAEHGDYPGLAALTAWHRREVPRTLAVLRAAVHGALAERGASAGTAEFAAALAGGVADAELARRAGRRLARRYAVLALPAQAPAAAAVRDEPDAVVHDDGPGPPLIFVGLDGDGPPVAQPRVRSLLRRLASRVPVGVVGTRGRADLPRAVRRARDAARFALLIGATGPVTPDELLVESAVAGDRHLSRRLAAVVAALDERPQLRDTLAVLYDCDLDRGRAAARLGVDPRTLRYRLARVREMTGLDPVSTRGVLTLVAGLAATRVAETGAAGSGAAPPDGRDGAAGEPLSP